MKADRIRALPIKHLGLSASGSNNVVEFIQYQNSSEWDPGTGRRKRKELERLVGELTIGDLISAYEDAERVRHPYSTIKYLVAQDGGARINTNTVERKLVQLGMTHFDWNVLPYSTVTLPALKRLKKEELLQQSILILNTLSSSAVSTVRSYVDRTREREAITIAELMAVDLDVDLWPTTYQWKTLTRSLDHTRKRLRELGFRYEDGPFLQFGTRRRLVESLMHNDNLSRIMAGRLADIAAKRGWVKSFVG